MSFDQILNKAGTDVTLKSASKTVIDEEYGTYDVTYTDSSIKAIVTGITDHEKLKLFGWAETGSKAEGVSAVAYISGSVDVKEEDQLVIGSKTFTVVMVQAEYLNGTAIYKKLWLREA